MAATHRSAMRRRRGNSMTEDDEPGDETHLHHGRRRVAAMNVTNPAVRVFTEQRVTPLPIKWRMDDRVPLSDHDALVTKFTNVRLVRGGKLVNDDLWVRNGVIIDPAARFWEAQNLQDFAAHRIIDCGGGILAPGFIDIQINGAVGVDFSSPTLSLGEVQRVAQAVLQHGVTAFLPTVVTSAPDVYRRVLPLLRPWHGLTFDASMRMAHLLGIHLEGPFINPECRGAHNVSHMALLEKGPTVLDEVYGDLQDVKLVTLAPELRGSAPCIRALRDRGIVVSMGHTMASLEDAEAAVNAGAGLITHLFNAMAPFKHREPGMLALLGSAGCPNFSIIMDGIHSHPYACRMAYDTQPEKIILITDAMAALGLEPGAHRLGDMDVTVRTATEHYRGLHAVLTGTTTLAGSVASMDSCVRNMVQFTGCSIAQAIDAATRHPAQALGLAHKIGTLDIGADADLVLLNDDLHVQATYISGHCAWRLPVSVSDKGPSPAVSTT